MAMNAGTLKTSMKAAVLAAIATFETPPSDERASGYGQSEFWDAVCGAISSTVIAHIQASAKVSGADTRGDTFISAGTSIA